MDAMRLADDGGAGTLVVGASGQVGLQLWKALQQRGRKALPTGRLPREGWLQMDLAELETQRQAAALLDRQALDAVLCVGGWTYVDGNEADPELAHRINARGPAVLAEYARGRGLPFVYFSTEYVFDGFREDPGPYAEDAPTNPLSAYGRSKLAGERGVLDVHPEALVVRTTVVYGPDEREKNYLYSLMKSLVAGTAMRVPEDQISTPTYNRDLANATLGLVDGAASGVFHVAGPELLGRLEFARRVAEELGLDASLLEGVSTAELKQTAARPLFAGLATDKLAAMYPELHMRSLQQSLENCRAELQHYL